MPCSTPPPAQFHPPHPPRFGTMPAAVTFTSCQLCVAPSRQWTLGLGKCWLALEVPYNTFAMPVLVVWLYHPHESRSKRPKSSERKSGGHVSSAQDLSLPILFFIILCWFKTPKIIQKKQLPFFYQQTSLLCSSQWVASGQFFSQQRNIDVLQSLKEVGCFFYLY